MANHITKVELNYLTREGGWTWFCTCGARGGLYPTRQRAANGAQLHRAAANIDGK